MDSDQGLRLLGKYSKWQLRSYFMYAFGFGVPFAWMYMSLVFIGDTPNHRCALPPNATVNDSIPLECDAITGVCVRSRCSVYVNISVDNSTMPCPNGYWYDPASGYESTLVTEWDLVCGTGWLVELSMTISSVGSAIGAIFFPHLSDLYGRKKIFLVCLWSNVPIAIATAFSPNYTFYVVMMFIDGLQQQGMVAVAAVLSMELFPTEQRTFAGNAIEFFWAFGYISLTPIAYFIRNWRYFQLAISVPMLCTISFYWFISESIPWLVANDKKEEANEIIRKAAKFNGISVPNNVFTDHYPLMPNIDGIRPKLANEDSSSSLPGNDVDTDLNIQNEHPVGVQRKTYSVMDIARSKVLRLYAAILFCIWFVNGFGYYALSYTVTYLPGNRYLNFFIYAVVEVPAYALAWFLMWRVGRRVPLSAFHIVGGIALVCTIIPYFAFAQSSSVLISILNMIGKFGITCSFAVIYVCTPEIFPTNIRNLGMGLCQLASKLGNYASPYARTLYRAYPWMPPVIIGVISVIVGVMALLLPETRHTPLPDTIEEIEAWNKNKRLRRR